MIFDKFSVITGADFFDGGGGASNADDLFLKIGVTDVLVMSADPTEALIENGDPMPFFAIGADEEALLHQGRELRKDVLSRRLNDWGGFNGMAIGAWSLKVECGDCLAPWH